MNCCFLGICYCKFFPRSRVNFLFDILNLISRIRHYKGGLFYLSLVISHLFHIFVAVCGNIAFYFGPFHFEEASSQAWYHTISPNTLKRLAYGENLVRISLVVLCFLWCFSHHPKRIISRGQRSQSFFCWQS